MKVNAKKMEMKKYVESNYDNFFHIDSLHHWWSTCHLSDGKQDRRLIKRCQITLELIYYLSELN